MILSIILVFSLLGVVDASQSRPAVAGVSRPNYGVDFNFMFQVNNMHGSWKHAWVIDLEVLHRSKPHDPDLLCMSDLQDVCDAEKTFLKHAGSILWEIVKNSTTAQSWIENPQLLQTINRRESTRVKRSWFPFVGNIEKTLFGIATEDDIASVKTMISDLSKLAGNDVDALSKMGDSLASLTKTSSSNAQNTKKGFENVKNTFANLTASINERFKQIYGDTRRSLNKADQLEGSQVKQWLILEGLVKMLANALMVLQDDNELMNGIQTILQGYIPINLVPPRDLIRGLNTAEEGIRSTFPDGRLSHPAKTLGYYYTHKLVTPIIDVNKIILVVDIPVDLKQQTLNVYAVRTFPVPLLPYNLYTHEVDPATSSSRAISELANKQSIFLINQEGTMYSESNRFETLNCQGEIVRTCLSQFPLYPFTRESCLSLLWNDASFDQILSHCPFQLAHISHATQHQEFTQIIPLSTGRWYVVAPLRDTWTIVCPQRPPEARKPCSSCVIQVDCGCGIKSQFFEIPTRVSSCDAVFSPLTKNYTVNPFSYLPKDTPWVVNLTGSDTFPSPRRDPPDIQLPSADNWDDVMESMDKTTYDLNRLYVKQKNETKMYRTSAEALLTKIRDQDELISSFSSWPEWIIGPAIILVYVDTFVLLMIVLCIFMRGAKAAPILSRFSDERRLVDHSSEALMSIEVLILLIVCIILILQLIMVWPTLMAWWRSNSIVRRLTNQRPRINAEGFVRRPQAITVLINGVARFASGTITRMIPVEIALSTLRQEHHLQDFPPVPDNAEVSRENDMYLLNLTQGFAVISHDDQTIQIKRFTLSPAKLQNAYSVPERCNLIEITDIHYFTEVHP